ncbi:UDP-N-acetylmuramoyl-tripeptide--D-alanyl-D-alanine ligase [Candidatus Sulfobium mesophilum]|uniref:UDP-N-acetylmuramoyl-tripeptide--D-alanyl-D-alanine ligase n=1 Tax=Candidatus Sulfobium mesophilum TaxID=2016548 RepID=A0A2U3QJJ5_9BACT|nr:UDP-N-acetylmuramoyl-tripeptide--D-alanyl-D-alanine ligase [Candidatus Sulfobium mesophilum]
MRLLLLDDIVKATGGKVLHADKEEFSGLSIDSRTIGDGELFVALRGERFDGHNFLCDALKRGAGAIVDREPGGVFEGRTLVYVSDTLRSLQDIARQMRISRDVQVVGVTGTNGKTTTKELIASVLGQRHKVLKTSGNLNNHIGVPLCISRMHGDETVMVIEMGSNAEGDIRLLCDIARPDIAVVTNVGPAHLEGFGSLEMVRKTDLEILEYVKTVSVNADDLFLLEGVKGFRGKTVTYGIRNKSDVSAKDVELHEKGARFTICFPDDEKLTVDLMISGIVNVYNALAAASVAFELGMEKDQIRSGLASFLGVPMRLEVKELSGALVISDVYNANPASMEEAVKELIRLKRRRAIAVLGDMLELGSYSESAHRELVGALSPRGVDILIAVGEQMKRASSEFGGMRHEAEDAGTAGSILSRIMTEGDTVLIKGSRGMRMETVLAGITEAAGVGEIAI